MLVTWWLGVVMFLGVVAAVGGARYFRDSSCTQIALPRIVFCLSTHQSTIYQLALALPTVSPLYSPVSIVDEAGDLNDLAAAASTYRGKGLDNNDY